MKRMPYQSEKETNSDTAVEALMTRPKKKINTAVKRSSSKNNFWHLQMTESIQVN